MEKNQQIPPISETPQQPDQKKKKKGCLKLLIVFLCIFFAIGILSIVVGHDDKEEKDAVEQEAIESVEEAQPKVNIELVNKLKNKFTYKEDEFKGITWVTPKDKPKHINTTGIYSYFALKDSVPQNMRFVIQYGADDWLFIKSYTFLIDGKTYEFSQPPMERDNDSRIWEWSDTGVSQDPELLVIVAALLNADEAKIRFNGKQYHNDYTIKKNELTSLKETFEYYEALGGK